LTTSDHLRARVPRAGAVRPACSRSGLGRKRSLAREFGLAVEALERLARADPLYRIHECVFGVLTLRARRVGPRL
jgi:protein phosphatase